MYKNYAKVLNLVINGWPSIQWKELYKGGGINVVLNLVINGWPSRHLEIQFYEDDFHSFKPCYKWMTFNTSKCELWKIRKGVLNLVINGWPSIL